MNSTWSLFWIPACAGMTWFSFLRSELRSGSLPTSSYPDRGNTRHVFEGCSKPGLIAAHETVRSTVDEDDRIEIQFPHKFAIPREKRFYTHAVERIDGNLFALLAKPTCENLFGEVVRIALGVSGHFQKPGRQAAAHRIRQTGE